MKGKKIGIWLLSTVAAVLVGLAINYMIAKKPKIESQVSALDRESLKGIYKTDVDFWSYTIEIRNAGDTTLRDIIGTIELGGVFPQIDREKFKFSNVDIRGYAGDKPLCNYKISYTKTGKDLSPIIEVRCELLRPNRMVAISFHHPCTHCPVWLDLTAVGYRYRANFDPRSGTAYDKYEFSEIE